MKVARLVACMIAVGTLSAAPAQARAQAPDRVVAEWIRVTLDEIAAHRLDPPHASRVLAYVSVAMERAVAASRPAAREDAAADGAAATILARFFPDGAGRLHRLAQRAKHARPPSPAGRGFALGRRAGEQLLAHAAADGADVPWSGTIPIGPGLWAPTPPGFLPPLLPGWGRVLTWNVVDPATLRPPPPPRPGEPRFEADLREVYRVSQTLTPEQRLSALFWADGPGTYTPPGHWNAIALDLVRTRGLSIAQEARLFAVLNTAQADAFVCIWETKYAYWSMRPITAIRREIDPAWNSLITTPPFPSYVSGHSGTSAAAATVLSTFFPAEAARLNAWAAEAAASRLYGGIHFRTDNDFGLAVGRAVGAAAVTSWGI